MTTEINGIPAISFLSLAILISLLMVINPDWFWWIQEVDNDMKGLESKKTEAWGCKFRLMGLLGLFLFGSFLLFSLNYPG